MLSSSSKHSRSHPKRHEGPRCLLEAVQGHFPASRNTPGATQKRPAATGGLPDLLADVFDLLETLPERSENTPEPSDNLPEPSENIPESSQDTVLRFETSSRLPENRRLPPVASPLAPPRAGRLPCCRPQTPLWPINQGA